MYGIHGVSLKEGKVNGLGWFDARHTCIPRYLTKHVVSMNRCHKPFTVLVLVIDISQYSWLQPVKLEFKYCSTDELHLTKRIHYHDTKDEAKHYIVYNEEYINVISYTYNDTF